MKKKWLLICNIIMMVCIVVNVACLGIFLHEKKSLKVKNATKVENTTATEGADTGASGAELSEKGGAFIVDENVTFTLTEGAVISGHKNRYGAAIYVFSGATFILDGGLITRNEGKFGTIYVEDGGTLILNRGEITGNYGQLAFRDEELGDYGIYLENPENLILGDGTKAYTEKTFTQVEYTDERYSELVHDNPYKLYEYTINYYVGTTIEAIERIDPTDAVLTLDGAPLTYEESMGYFVEDEYINGAEIGMTLSVNNVQSLAANTTNNVLYSDKYGTINLYTKKATLDKLSFTLNSTDNKYSVKAKDSSITGEVVIPREYNGKEVYQIAEKGFTIYTSSTNTYSKLPITSAYIPATITTIEKSTFALAYDLTFINLPQGVEVISSGAFARCSKLKVVRFPASLTSYASNAFQWCSGINTIKVDSNNEKYCSSINNQGANVVIDKTSNSLVLGCKTSVIPEGVINIAAASFYGQESLTKINIPSTVTKIESDAFDYCKTLESIVVDEGNTVYTSRDSSENEVSAVIEISTDTLVQGSTTSTIPKTVVTIGEHAFYGINITSVVLPTSVKTLESYAFQSSGLESLTIPNSVTSIEEYAFYGCLGIKTLDFGANITTLKTGIFSGCTGITTLTVSGALESVSKDLFGGCKSLVTLNVSVPLADSAFKSCTKLQNLTIGDISKISARAFSDCSALTNIDFSNSSIQTVWYDAFNGCSALSSIDVSNSSIQTVDTRAFYNCSALSDINFNGCSSLTSIADTSFSGCTSLTTITATDFAGCSKLSTMSIPNSITSIGASAFKDCTELSTLYYRASTETLDASVFAKCTKIKKLTISGSLTNTAKGLFGGCANLTTLNISSSLEVEAFYGCTSLSTVNLNGDSLEVISSDAFYGCTSLSTVDLSDCENITTIGYRAFQNCSALSSIDLSSLGVNTTGTTGAIIQQDAFSGCTSLESVTLSERLGQISSGAFKDCKITNIELKNSTIFTNIMSSAFEGCESLKEVNFSGCKKLKIVGSAAFYKCYSLSKIVFTGCTSLTYIDDYAFAGANMESFTIPNSVTSIGVGTFSDCRGLKSVTIGSGLTTIPSLCFEGAFQLESLIIPSNIKYIKPYAFLGCSSLTKIKIPSTTTCEWSTKTITNDDDLEDFLSTSLGLSGFVLGSSVGSIVGGAVSVTLGAVGGVVVGLALGTAICTMINNKQTILATAFTDCTSLTIYTDYSESNKYWRCYSNTYDSNKVCSKASYNSY